MKNYLLILHAGIEQQVRAFAPHRAADRPSISMHSGIPRNVNTCITLDILDQFVI
jgi:hypothetical protein